MFPSGTAFILMFDSCGLDVANYDSILIGWANQTVQNNMILGAENINFCLAFDARSKLINDYNWIIIDGGRKCDFGFKGSVLHDINQNKIQDADEYGLANQKLMILPDSSITLTDADGNYYFSVPNGDYQVVILPSEYYDLSTDSSSYHILIPEDNGKAYVFGLKENQSVYKLSSSLTSAPTRCNFTVPFWLSYQNDGTLKADGKVKLLPDEKVTFVSSSDAFTQSGDTLIWDYSDLRPSERRQIQLEFEMPGVDNIGDTLNFIHLVEAIENNTITFSFTDTLSSEIRCAYDPNDKTATPFGVGDEHYTLKDQFLEYRIRFQNTGNDTAFNVVIRDTLQADFDLSTFEVISSSHSMRTQLDIEGRALAFHFENILLPDSIVDEPNSHGYVTFRIRPNAGLPDNTEVMNTAHIYFDFNPAIVTNTSFNTLVDELPNDHVTGQQLEDISKFVTVFPNPNSSNEVIVRLSNSIKGEFEIILTDIAGRELNKLRSSNMQSKQDLKFDISQLNQGIYFIQIIQQDVRAVKKLIRQ